MIADSLSQADDWDRTMFEEWIDQLPEEDET